MKRCRMLELEKPKSEGREFWNILMGWPYQTLTIDGGGRREPLTFEKGGFGVCKGKNLKRQK